MHNQQINKNTLISFLTNYLITQVKPIVKFRNSSRGVRRVDPLGTNCPDDPSFETLIHEPCGEMHWFGHPKMAWTCQRHMYGADFGGSRKGPGSGRLRSGCSSSSRAGQSKTLTGGCLPASVGRYKPVQLWRRQGQQEPRSGGLRGAR